MLLNTVLSLSLLAVSVGDLSPQPVDTINVQEYVGKWYEIGKLPTPDQPNCFNVTADYELLDDGQVGVINSCRIKLFWGLSFPWFIGGKAKAVEGEVGQFDLTLRPLSAIIPFGNKYERGFKVTGKYWVLELGDDYEYALVGEPTKSNLFILSRTKRLPQSTIDMLLELAETKHGYDNAAARVEFTEQR